MRRATLSVPYGAEYAELLASAQRQTRNTRMTSAPANDRPYYGFDYLRAVLSIAIVAWHARLLGESSIFSETGFSGHHLQVSDVINLHFFLLAVPTFILVSLFLTYRKLRGNPKYIVGRVEGFVYLYVFWVGLWTLYNWKEIRMPSLDFDYVWYVLRYAATGGSSEYYFFFSLIIVTCLCYFAAKLTRPLLWILLTGSLLLIWLFPIGVSRLGWPTFLIASWDPLNFVPYIFIAALASDYLRDEMQRRVGSLRFKIILLLLLVLALLAATWEWLRLPDESNFVAGNAFALPSYTRLSIVAGASLVFLMAFFVRHRPGKYIMFLSDYSLGLYCIHPLVLKLYDSVAGSHDSFVWVLGKFLMAVILSLVCAVLLRRLLTKRLV